ncbi:MAG: ABC transporter substrate-binding protein, partial [Leptolyngbyaceae cyanobacterium bins.59]|nr:ABC transporter substrate-binding protein [Leptolyngbyaceae cyanobacterium bins.59]
MRALSYIKGAHFFPPLFALVLAVILGGCSPAQFKTAANQVPQIVVSSLSDPKTFNLPLSQESTIIFSLIYEGLVTENGVTGAIEPGIAESWEVTNNDLRYVFKLREGLKWSDGEPLTAEDVDFTYNKIFFNEEIPTDYRDVLRIGEEGKLPQVRALDDRRIEFVLPEPFAPFLTAVGTVL